MTDYKRGMMNGIVIGLMIGMSVVGVAWAAQGITLVNGGGTEIGTSSNPIQVIEV